ncbi:MAG: ABC transporter permease [Bacteroidales bacterium]|nr:ABC transporter permease [Bacteroidales bacterium]MBN2748114.1 ABC transporter permease [Bacteroidales bacterium]
MIWINLKLTIRNLLRNKGFSFINIFGLTVGMTTVLLLLLWVNFETSYDKFHKNSVRLYQLACMQEWNGDRHPMPNLPGKVIDMAKEKYPEIEFASNVNTFGESVLFTIGDKNVYKHVYNLEGDFFKMFSFPIVKGDTTGLLTDPYALLLSETEAKNLFGDTDPIGQSILVNNTESFKVTAIFKDFPKNSAFKGFSCIGSFEYLKRKYNFYDQIGSHWFFGYVQIKEGTQLEDINKKLETFYKDYVSEESTTTLFLYPVAQSNLYHLGRETGIRTVKMFTFIALLILAIACFNFMNLSTARASKRAKEIGLKKTIGASRAKLIWQFIGESMLISFVAVNFSILLAQALLPEFNNLMGRELTINYTDINFVLITLGIILTTGFLAGVYPAFYLTKFNPIRVLKGENNRGKSGARFRTVLVVLQFSLSIGLIIAALTVGLQMNHMRNLNLGFNKKDLVYLHLRGNLNEKRELVRTELLSNPLIENVTFVSHMPCEVYTNGWGAEWEGKDPEFKPLITYFRTDPHYIKTMGIEMAEGEFFPENPKGADSLSVVINKTLADMISSESVIGKTITQSGNNLKIIGVTKDFNFTHIHGKIEPLLIYLDNAYNALHAKVNPSNYAGALEHIQQVCQKYNPGFPVSPGFVDDYLSYMYSGESQAMKMLIAFSILAMIISLLGIFGLASFMAEARTKEVGVRKVMGASVSSLVTLFSFGFTKWVLLANIIAWPAAWYFLRNWLNGVSNRIDMPYWVFAAVGLVIFTIAFLVVSFQSYKAASRNPVESIKYE